MSYQNIENILGKEWLKTHAEHPYFDLNSRPQNRAELSFLSNYNDFLERMQPHFPSRKRLVNKLRNAGEFFDTYYELKVGCLLKDKDFSFSYEPILAQQFRKKTPDFLVEEKTIIDVKVLHETNDVKQRKPYEVFEPNKYKLLAGVITNEIRKWKNEMKQPFVIFTCPDEIENTSIYADDYESVLFGQKNYIKISRNGTVYREPRTDYFGLFYQDYGLTTSSLSGVVRLHKSQMQFWENPNAKKEFKIPEEAFLTFLRNG